MRAQSVVPGSLVSFISNRVCLVIEYVYALYVSNVYFDLVLLAILVHI